MADNLTRENEERKHHHSVEQEDSPALHNCQYKRRAVLYCIPPG